MKSARRRGILGVSAALCLLACIFWLFVGPFRTGNGPEPQPTSSETVSTASEADMVEDQTDETGKEVPEGSSMAEASSTTPPARPPEPAIFLRQSGPVEVINSRVRTLPDGTEIGEQLLRTEGKYPYKKVEFSPSGRRPTTVMIADHILVQFSNGVTTEEVQSAVQREGYSIRKKLIHEGLYLIAANEPSLDAVPEMISRLREMNAVVDVAEPDYVHFPR